MSAASDDGDMGAGVPESVHVDVHVWSLLGVVAAVVAALTIVGLVAAAHRVLGWVVATALVAVLVQPVVDVIGRAVPRFVAAVVTLLLLTGVVAALAWLGLEGLRSDAHAVSQVIADAAERIEEQRGSIGRLARDVDLGHMAEQATSGVSSRISRNDQRLAEAAGAVPAFFVCGVLTAFMLLFGPGAVRSGVDRLWGEWSERTADRERSERTTDVLHVAVVSSRRYVWATIGEAVVVAALAAALAAALDVTALTAFVLIAFVMALLPYVGIILGAAPYLLVALAGRPAWQVGLVALLVAALQVVEAVAVRPWIDARSVHVGPTVPLVMALLGLEVYGLGGALCATMVGIGLVALADAAASDDPEPEVAGIPDEVPLPTEPWDDDTGAAPV